MARRRKKSETSRYGRLKNVDMRIGGTARRPKLVITIDLSRSHGLSASGKSYIVASTSGNVEVPDHPELKIGLTVYEPQ